MAGSGRASRVALLAAGLLVVSGLGACSIGSATATGSASPTEAVATFMHALGDKDSNAACSQVSTGGKPLADAGFDQCTVGLKKVLAALQDPAEIAKLKSAAVTGATVNGDRATVAKNQITNLPQGYENDIDLVRIGGRWYIDSKS